MQYLSGARMKQQYGQVCINCLSHVRDDYRSAGACVQRCVETLKLQPLVHTSQRVVCEKLHCTAVTQTYYDLHINNATQARELRTK
jgi:hypothetical protein